MAKRIRKQRLFVLPGIAHVAVYKTGEDIPRILFELGRFTAVIYPDTTYYVYTPHFWNFN